MLTINELRELVKEEVVSNPNREVVIDLISIGIHLDNHFMTYEEYPLEPFTPPKGIKTKTIQTDEFIIPPMGKVLACSEEILSMPLELMGLIQTKGSLARGFLTVHMCDGQIDPGYRGKITLELFNFSDFYYKLVPGMAIARLFLIELTSSVAEGYNGRYQGSDTPTSMQGVKI